MSNIVGIWIPESNDNCDAFFNAVGYGLLVKKAMLSSTFHLLKVGDVWIFKFESSGNTKEIKFKEGVSFEEGNLSAYYGGKRFIFSQLFKSLAVLDDGVKVTVSLQAAVLGIKSNNVHLYRT